MSELDTDPVCFSIKPHGYEIFIKMGDCCNGTASIFLGKHKATDHFVAIRQIPLEECCLEVEDIHHEIKMHRIFSCPHILNYYATFLSSKTLWIVMPLQGYGSCVDIIQAGFTNGLPEVAITLIFHEILQALVYLHDCGVIHRSIRASHVLVSDTGRVFLSGLRNCYTLEKQGIKESKCWHFPTNSPKSLKYFSPEVLSQDLHGYDQKSDIYSLGILACELANGHAPYTFLKAPEMLYEKLQGNAPQLLDSSTLEDEDEIYGRRKFSPEFHQFVSLCCSFDPSDRPPAAELLNHGFIKRAKKVPLSQLPAMLNPVTPLTDSNLKSSENTGAISSLVHNMSNAMLTDDVWNF